MILERFNHVIITKEKWALVNIHVHVYNFLKKEKKNNDSQSVIGYCFIIYLVFVLFIGKLFSRDNDIQDIEVI